MSKVSIQGDQNGTGDFTIKAPNSNSDRTLTIPDSDGELLYTDSNGDLSVDGDTFYVDSANNRVGIGTNSPNKSLHVQTTGNNIGTFETSSTADMAIEVKNSQGSMFFGLGGGEQFAVGTDADLNGPNSKFQIKSNGDLLFDSGYGSVATAYACRAWVNFDGTGTVSIREDGNVSSITDNAAGNYTVNFTTAMPDANYGVSTGTSDNGVIPILRSFTTSSFVIACNSLAGAGTDSATVCASIFR